MKIIPDLEDVLTKLYKFKESLSEAIEFIDKIIKLFGSWDATYDMFGDGDDLTLKKVINVINDVLIYNK